MVFKDSAMMMPKHRVRLKPGILSVFNLRLKSEAIHRTKRWVFVLALLLIVFCSPLTAQTRDYTKWVNPFIGTGGHGHTFPGATMPFGMVQLSPDTRIDNWDGSSGYHYSDDTIYGFSHTHLSGTGIPDGCDILFMPTVGEPRFFAKEGDKSVNGYASKFSHANEKAEPGYYSVQLDDDGILAEMTSTMRVGMHRYTFPAAENSNLILDLKWRDKILGSVFRVVGNSRVEGFRRSESWAKNQTVYFAAEFSKRFDRITVAERTINVSPLSELRLATAGQDKAAFRFNTADGEKILLKVGISFVSIEGARKNLEAELPGWDFDKVRADAKAAWNKELGKIEVSGGTDAQTTTFYSALYHTMIHPNVFNDVDGRYRGHDGKIHALSPGFSRPAAEKKPPKGGTPNADQYTVFSLWDTFRAAHPLYTIIDQRRTVDFINTFIRQYEQGGRLPVWELWGEETDTMIGYHAVSVIADAMTKGIKGFDYDKAYAAAKHSAELDHFGLKDYKRRGYISMEDENESVSRTLEYAYNDWCIARMATVLLEPREAEIKRGFISSWNEKSVNGLRSDKETYLKRARYFENLFDPSTGFMRPKKNGGFVTPFAPNEVTFNFTEGNSWVYSFFVPHDVARLMELMGGREKFAAKLDELFNTKDKLTGREQPDITGLIGQYAHGNEPSHHIAYLYNYAGQPWKTQDIVRRIMDEFYKPEPNGLIGNEDCGQMSAWYIMSAAGFYPVAPGEPVYQIGTPLFKEMKFNLENGKTFVVKAPNVSSVNHYIASARLNGLPLRRTFITHADVMNGGVLEFTMADKPVTTAFTEFPGSSRRSDSVAVPIIEGGGRAFSEQTTVTMKSIVPGSKILFGTDRVDPAWSQYTAPVPINATTTIYAKTVNASGSESPIVEATFLKKPNDWTVKIDSKYNRQYTGGGDEGLIDGIRGSTNFASGEWQGYQGQDFVATVDLKRDTVIRSVGGGFLQVARSWIWMPTRIEIEASGDGVNFDKVGVITPDFPPEYMTPTYRDYLLSTDGVKPLTARYIRMTARNLGKIPSWHPGAGFEAFIFVDEMIIR